jgi:hypothetical protein
LIPMGFRLDKKLDIIDSSLENYLATRPAGFVDWDHDETSRGRIVYDLRQKQLGSVGTIIMRMVDDYATKVTIGNPPRPAPRKHTEAELKELQAALNDGGLGSERYLTAAAATSKVIQRETDELYEFRCKHLSAMVDGWFEQMCSDGIMVVREMLPPTSVKGDVGNKQVDSGEVAEQATPAEDEEGKVGIFFAYAREDETLRDELEKHLSSLKRKDVITSWHDRRISAGKEWEGEIDTYLNTARVILLLISPDFIASDYCWDVEVKRAMERHEAGEARVIPIILRPVDWKSAPFGKLQALPTDAKPVTTWTNQDEAFLDVAQGIRAAVTELRAEDNDSNPNHERHNP